MNNRRIHGHVTRPSIAENLQQLRVTDADLACVFL